MLSKLKEIRLNRGVKGKDLAERIGIDPSYLTLIEAGREPSQDVKSRIAKALKLSIKSLWEA